MMRFRVTNIMAVSLDGKISLDPLQPDSSRFQAGFTSKEDRELLRESIREADAIILGANSVRASGRLLAQKNKHGRYPKWFIYTRSGLDICPEFSKGANVAWCFVSKNNLNIQADVENIAYGNSPPARHLIELLKQDNQIRNVILFGGGQVNRFFYEEDLVDDLKITICPYILASQTASNFVDPRLLVPKKLTLNSSQAIGDHVFLSYTIQRLGKS